MSAPFFCYHIFLAVTLSGFALTALAQHDRPTCRTTAMLTVIDEQGKAVPGLTTASFRATLNRAQAKFAGVSAEERPRQAVIVVDASTSMRRRYWKHALGVAEAVLANLPAQHQVSLLGFSEGVRLAVTSAGGRPALQAGLRELQRIGPKERRDTGDTNVLDAIGEALALQGNPRPGDLVFLVTDGGGGRAHSNADAVRQALLARQIRLVIAWLMPVQVPSYAPTFLSDLADETGGTFVQIGTGPFVWSMRVHNRTLGAGKEVVANVAATSATAYRMEFPEPLSSASTLEVHVVDAAGKERKDVMVNHPRKVLPCNAPATP